MKKTKTLALLMAAVMTLSMVACGEKTGNETPTTEPTAGPVEETVQETSIDFEDGNFGFAMAKTKPRKADESVLSVKDYNGSKALYVQNAGGSEMHVGIDVDAILGDKVTEVRSISMTVGTEHSDGKFAAVAGNLFAYTGEALTENQLESWSVYMEHKNPYNVTFTMPEGVAFTAGNDNYICLAKLKDNGKVFSSLYIDDIRFFDANGNVLKGDTTVAMEAPNGFLKVVEEEEPMSASDVKVTLDDSYKGDWALTTAIPADAFATFTNGVKVTLKFELESGYDYYLWKALDASWGPVADCGLVAKDAAEEGEKYHMQADGFIVMDDFTNTELTLTLPADVVAAVVAGGGLAGQTYGVTMVEAVLSDPAAGAMTEKAALDDGYKGDWGLTTAIPADVLAKFPGDVTVTLKFDLESGYDYYLFKPLDASWGAIADYGLVAKDAAEEGDKYHMQTDGFIVIDDWTNNALELKIKAADLATIIAAGGLAGQTYGVTVYEAVITGGASATAEEPAAEDVADEAQDVADEAQDAADAAQDVADEAQDAADEAQDAADEAQDTADEAQDVTDEAQDAADEAQDVTDEAQDAADEAQDVTDEAQDAADDAQDTADVVEVALDDAYKGDWALTTAIPADVLAKFPGDVTVTLKFELESGYEYYLWKPMDASWGAIADYGFTAKDAAEEGDLYHMQPDGFIVIDDWTNNELVLKIKAADLAGVIAAGGLAGQTYGINVYEAVIEG